MTGPGPVNLNIDINSIPSVKCEKCESERFQQAFIIKKLSALTSPNGREGMIPITTFACIKCGHINKEFLPSGGPAAGSAAESDGEIQTSKLSLLD